MSGVEEVRLRRLRTDEQWLNDTARDLQELLYKERCINDDIGVLREQMRAISLKIDVLKTKRLASSDLRAQILQRRESVRQYVNEERRRLCPFAFCDPDVLSSIFLFATCDVMPKSETNWHWNAYPQRLTAAPFRISAVSRHWRNVALSYPEVWYYARIPQLSTKNTLSRIQAIVSRSRAVSLDVYMEHYDGALSPYFIQAVGILASALSRWRILSLRFRTTPQCVVQALIGAAPRLECLYLSQKSRAIQEHDISSQHLCGTELLDSMVVQNMHLIPVNMASVSTLTVIYDCPNGIQSDRFWDSLASARQLSDLFLDISDESILGIPLPVEFPSLWRLKLGRRAPMLYILHPNMIRAPQIVYLVLDQSMCSGDDMEMLGSLQKFMDGVADSLPFLALVFEEARLTEADAQVLISHTACSRISILQLKECRPLPEFWRTMAAPETCPQLRSLGLRQKNELPQPSGVGLCDFIRTRPPAFDLLVSSTALAPDQWTALREIVRREKLKLRIIW